MTVSVSTLTFSPLNTELASEAFAIDQRVSATPWSIEVHRGSFDAPAFSAWGLFDSQRLVAFAYVHAVLDEAFVLQVAVDAPYQKQGVGANLLTRVLGELRCRGLRVVSLEVRASNIAAQRLYARCGFTTISIRRKYYKSPEEDALLMTAELAPA